MFIYKFAYPNLSILAFRDFTILKGVVPKCPLAPDLITGFHTSFAARKALIAEELPPAVTVSEGNNGGTLRSL